MAPIYLTLPRLHWIRGLTSVCLVQGGGRSSAPHACFRWRQYTAGLQVSVFQACVFVIFTYRRRHLWGGGRKWITSLGCAKTGHKKHLWNVYTWICCILGVLFGFSCILLCFKANNPFPWCWKNVSLGEPVEAGPKTCREDCTSYLAWGDGTDRQRRQTFFA